jgi:carbonic anhydrase
MFNAECSRSAFLRRSGLGFSSAAFAMSALSATSQAIADGGELPMAATTPADALARLKAGNARFAKGPLDARVAELVSGQNPFAIVLGCSDSRVPVETVFDQEPGQLFVVRVAGNFVSNDGLGSIEYAIAVLKSKLVLVLGHSGCGAVTAAVSFVRDGTTQPSHIQDLVSALAPAAQATRGVQGDWVTNAIAENVRQNVQAVASRSTIVANGIKAGALEVVGGVYDLRSGSVTFL